MLDVLGVMQLLVMYAGLLLLGQGAIYLLCLGRHDGNPVYRFMRFLTSPVTRLARIVSPSRVAQQHLPVVAFFLLFWTYLALALVIPQFAGDH